MTNALESTIPVNHTEKILIAEDEQSVRDILSKYLTRMGYAVTTAQDGMVALKKLEAEQFDLVLTDIKMPNMDGRELLKAMAQRFPDIPKIVLTGVQYHEDIILALQTGAYDYINKPIINFEILTHSIERALEKKRLNDDRNRFYDQLTQITGLVSMLNRGKDTVDIIRSLAVSLKSIIPFNRLSLTIIEDDRLVVDLVEADQEIKLGVGQLYPLHLGSFTEKSPSSDLMIIKNLHDYFIAHPGLPNAQLLVNEGIQSCLILPLIINDILRGFLIFSSNHTDIYQREHIVFLESIVGQISFSIQRAELIADLERHSKNLEGMVKARTDLILKTQRTTIFALSLLATARDNRTGEHLNRLRKYCVLIAQILKYTTNQFNLDSLFIRNLYDSSILHDIGKVGIPDAILLKPGQLTSQEFEIIKTHAVIGYNALKIASKDLGEDSFLKMALDITRHHHERWDGSGYPDGLKGEQIPLSARIVSIADVYDALTSERPYKEAFTHDKAIQTIIAEEYRFDPQIFKIFVDNEKEINTIRNEFQ